MEALEVQILSGVHAGSRFPVAKALFRLASDEHADLALLDAALEGQELTFSATDGGALSIMSRADYEIFDAFRVPVRPKTRWAKGQFLLIADVWLALGEPGAPLMSLPTGERTVLAAEFSEALKTPPRRESTLKLNPAPAKPQPESEGERREARRVRRTASIALLAIVIAVLLAGGAVALIAVQADQSLQQAVAAQSAARAAAPKKPVVELSGTSETLASDPAELAAMRLKAAREALEKGLDQAGLAEDVKVQWGTDAVALEASINARVLRELELVLFDFDQKFGGSFKVEVKVTPLWMLLPFRIREVVAGGNGWVVTENGERILVGGEFSGYRLVLLSRDRLIFSGPKVVELDL